MNKPLFYALSGGDFCKIYSPQKHHHDTFLYYIVDSNTNFLIHPVKLEMYCYLLCVQGNLTILVDTISYSITDNMIFNAVPYQLLQIVESSENMKCKVVFMDPSYYDHVENKGCVIYYKRPVQRRLNTKLSLEIVNYLQNMYDFIGDSLKATTELSEEITKTLIFALYLKYCSIIQDIHILSRNDQVLHEFLGDLSRYYTQEMQVKFYAQEQKMKPKDFARIIKAGTAKTPSQIIHDYIITEAKFQLKFSGQNVARISRRLHFSSPSSFGKYFKKYAGISPKKYALQEDIPTLGKSKDQPTLSRLP